MSVAEATTSDESAGTAGDGVADEAAAAGKSGVADSAPESSSESTEAAQAASGETPELEWKADYLGEDGKVDLSKIHERLTAVDAAPEGVPADPDGYDIALVETIEIAKGQALEFSKDDPLVAQFLKDAHAAGKSQEQVQAELTLAGQVLKQNFDARDAASKAAIETEIAKIGPDRIKATHQTLTQSLGASDANTILSSIGNAEAFEAVERLVTKANGGIGGRSPDGGAQASEKLPLHKRLFNTSNS